MQNIIWSDTLALLTNIAKETWCSTPLSSVYWTGAGADPRFLERGFVCINMIKGLGFALLILSHFS